MGSQQTLFFLHCGKSGCYLLLTVRWGVGVCVICVTCVIDPVAFNVDGLPKAASAAKSGIAAVLAQPRR